MATTATSKNRANRFKSNLRSLIANAGLTQREFADKIDLPYNWIRKSCNDGIARSHPRNEKSLRAISDFFNLSNIDSLWGKRVTCIEWKKEDLAEQHREFVDDFNWMLKEFPGDHNVAEVKRVIGEVVEHIRCPDQDVATGRQPDPQLRSAMTRAERFKSNLRHLIQVARMTQKEFAERIGVPYIWLRKSCTNGVARLHPTNEKHMRAICDFFRLRKTESLWNGRLIDKRLQSIDDVAEQQKVLVSDLIWLLKEHGDSQSLQVRSHVSEVKRVIAKVVKHLYVPKEKTAHAPQPERPQRTWAEIIADLDNWLATESTFQEPLRRRYDYSTPTRNVRYAEVNRKSKFYVHDIEDLDDQIDEDMRHRDEDHDEDLDREYDAFQAELAHHPSPELIEANNRLSRSVFSFIDHLPDSLKAALPDEGLSSLVARMIFRKVPLEKLQDALIAFANELYLERRANEIIDELPESLKEAFTDEELMEIVENQISKGVPSKELRRVLDQIGEVRGVVANPEIMKRQKRIRRRQIPLRERR